MGRVQCVLLSEVPHHHGLAGTRADSDTGLGCRDLCRLYSKHPWNCAIVLV